MAGVALFLCSRASSHVTGAQIMVDGGQTLAGDVSVLKHDYNPIGYVFIAIVRLEAIIFGCKWYDVD